MTLGNLSYKWFGQTTDDIQGLIKFLHAELELWASLSAQQFTEKPTKTGIEWMIGRQVIAAICDKVIFLCVPKYIKQHISDWPVIRIVETNSSPYQGWISITLGDDPRQYLRGLLRTAFEFGLSRAITE